ncbi:MAG: hypothetical protein Pars2KO_23040 [Parasphingorhabdus sp.]
MNKPAQVEKLQKGTFILVCLDGNNTEDLRRDHMFGHLDHIEKYNDLYRVAGPLKSDDGEFYGSFFMVSADDEAEARSIIEGDPYVTCGLFETITVYPFIPACGEWMGGVTWDQDVVRANMEQYS